MSLKLTEEMIIRKAKGNFSLPYIKNLKFFNSFLKDISIVSQCKSIESATFSTNNISSLSCFKNLQNLRELSLASNNISDINELTYLGTCPNLTKLWLKNNPISKLWDYRIQVIRFIPSLIYLDDQEITKDEKIMANTGFFGEGENQNIKKRMYRPPSHDPMRIREHKYNNNNQYGMYNKREIESEEINYNFPGMILGKKYVNNNELNKYDRFQRKKSETPSKIYDRYGNGKRGISLFNNNNLNYQENNKENYNGFGRNIPGSAQSHIRKAYENNPLSISNNNVHQQRVVNFIFDELKGLNNDELLYLIDFIDEKIEKMK